METEFKKFVGNNIRKKRTELGLSPQDVFKATKIPVESLSRMENGRVMPSDDSIAKVAECFGVSPIELKPESVRDMPGALLDEKLEVSIKTYNGLVADLALTKRELLTANESIAELKREIIKLKAQSRR